MQSNISRKFARSRKTMARVVRLLTVAVVAGFGIVAYADHVGFEKLDPPLLLTSGQIATGTGLLPLLAQYLRTAQGALAPTQYRLTLKEADLRGVTALQITLRGPGAPNLHLRFGKIVEIKDGVHSG